MTKPSTHRKSWLDRIAYRARKHNYRRASWSSYSYLTTALILILTLFASPTSATPFVQIATAGSGSSSFTMPTAFDTSFGNNFTETACKDWFAQFLVDTKPCYAVSLMLQTSTSFFDATKNLVTITRVLDASCNVNYQQCSAMMSTYSSQLMQSDTCQQDYKLLNPILAQAYAGLLAYQPLYGATCLKDTSASSSIGASPAMSLPAATSTASSADGGAPFGGNGKSKRQTSTSSSSSAGQYCFARAITNANSPSGAYVYYLPLGSNLPGGTIPTCDSCLQSTMKGFASYASNASQPISQTYAGAASDVDMFCGPTFVEQNVGASGVGMLEAPRWGVFVSVGLLWLWALI